MTKFHTDQVMLVLATRNPDKVHEIRLKLDSLSPLLAIYSLADLDAQGFKLPDVEETESSLEGNALKKAKEIFHALTAQGESNVLVLSDDTGLEVEALGGKPGVHSARYAAAELGRQPTYSENVAKLLREMQNIRQRQAVFRTVMALVGQFHLANHYHSPYFECIFEGKIHGAITTAPRGENGFGYDPVFEVPSIAKTFAELSVDEKNQISHRALALERVQQHLQPLFSKAY
jgi:non-canonical purine NTP pyrophosphatase, rdgB/HAM1 family